MRQQHNEDQILRDLKAAYTAAFEGALGKVLLDDLAHFCYAYSTTESEDPNIMQRREGRRQVFLKIMAMLDLDLNDILNHQEEDYD
jgi:hypothetical protein